MPVYGHVEADDDNAKNEEDVHETVLKKWKRYMKVVFAPWAEASGPGIKDAVEYEVGRRGIISREAVDNPADSKDN